MNKINVDIKVNNIDMKNLFNSKVIEINDNLNLSNNSSIISSKSINSNVIETLDIYENNNKIEDLKITDNEQENSQTKKYSPNSYSDKDNIYINKLSDIMTCVKNDLGEENYKIYTKYLEGKKISEICTNDDKLSPITDELIITKILKEMQIDKDAHQVMKEINQVLQNSSFDGSTLSTEMKNSTIIEVESTDSGYDAFVLKNSVDNYVIVNSCTNGNTAEDIATIVYILSLQLVGDEELISLAINNILPTIKNNNIESADFASILINGGTDYLKEKSQGQLQDNKKLIEKYAIKAQEEGTKIELNGYSLGGGIQLAAYSQICIENPNIENIIESVSVFNPFISFVEQQKRNTGFLKKIFDNNLKEPNLIEYLASSEKLTIYACQEDMVSTFNTSIEELKDKFVFLNAKDIEEGTVQDITQLTKIVLGEESNHDFSAINQEYFNETGNIIKAGEYIPITETVADATNQQTILTNMAKPVNKKIYDTNYEYLYKEILSLAGITDGIQNIDPSAKLIAMEVMNYIENNIGNISYAGLADSITNGCWYAIKDKINNEWYSFLGTFANENTFKESMNQWLNEEGTKERIIEIISNLQANNNEAAKEGIQELINKLDETYSNKIWGIDLVNNTIKNEFINQLKNMFI